MRCACCGRWRRRLRTGRGPDGRLLFDWCAECHADVHFRALGLLPGLAETSPRDPTAMGEGEDEPGAVARQGQTRPHRDDRSLALRALGLLLVLWGLLLELVGAGAWLGLGPPDNGIGPTRVNRLQLFSAAGGVMAIVGVWIGLSSLDRESRRRSIARAIEALALGLGLCVLIVGIVFHDPRRDPWIVAVVFVAVIAAWGARQWSRPRKGNRARPLASG
jgi:hypothetical protein